MISLPTWVLGAVLAAVIALTALRFAVLDPSGAVAAWLAGTVAMGAGWDWGILLIGYFASSSALSRWRQAEKIARTAGRAEKSGARDAVQVAANGGVFVAAALAYWISPGPLWQVVALGGLSASASDTWATEIGSILGRSPRSILSGAPVPPGTSGGVSAAGFGGGVAAAGFMAAVAALCGWPAAVLVAGSAGGLAGSIVDSLLGASVQARFWCASCGSGTERRRHQCGRTTSLAGGVAWLDNDGVNALATASGAALAVIIHLMPFRW